MEYEREAKIQIQEIIIGLVNCILSQEKNIIQLLGFVKYANAWLNLTTTIIN